jgi:Nucleotide-diphospho-sugar transferase
LKVVFADKATDSNCIAVVGHPVESFHVHRFHRMPKFESDREADNIEASKGLPLRLVQRAVETGGNIRTNVIPKGDQMDRSLEELGRYLTRLNRTLEALKPVAEAAARGGKTVVAMTVNQGQSDLFANFVCAARSRGLDLSRVVLFATDEATFQLASSMGVNAFEVRGAFGPMPAKAADFYGDEFFARMVLAKVYSVHLLVLLGYDVLLQDVDVVWMRNPLEFFNAPRFSQYDMVFQDDGSRTPEFSPHFANTGCFFVRNNDRTQYLYNHLVRMGDVIRVLKCDQMAMSVALNEIVSWKGLRVKVLGRDTADGLALPGGFHFHRRFDYMRKFLIRREVEPYVLDY